MYATHAGAGKVRDYSVEITHTSVTLFAEHWRALLFQLQDGGDKATSSSSRFRHDAAPPAMQTKKQKYLDT